MFTALTRYSHIITTQAHALLNSNTLGMTETQRRAVITINKHAQRLSTSVESLETLPDNDLPTYVTKQLIQVVAPIQSYAHILCSEWSGALNNNQSMHVEIILNSASDLQHILAESINSAQV